MVKKVSIRRVISIWSLSPKTRVEACQITVDRINSSRFINGGGAGGQNTVKQSLRGSPNKAQADLNWDDILLYLNTKKQGEGPSKVLPTASPYNLSMKSDATLATNVRQTCTKFQLRTASSTAR